MKLIWTYNFNVNMDGMKKWHSEVLTEFYKLSITTAKKLGYHTIIYTNSTHSHIFKPYVDEIITVEDYEGSPLFDSFKIKVLEDRNDDFYLIDGDVILNSRIPEMDVDITFDAYEAEFWKHTYGDQIKELLKLNINDTLPIFNEKAEKIFNGEDKIFNCGLLRITNKKLKDVYVDYWKRFNSFVKTNGQLLNKDQTLVAGQYILTMIAKEMDSTVYPLSKILGEENDYYRHYVGKIKFSVKPPFIGDKRLF
jgi:hypothetical protein